jgi:IS30 family transposase
MPTGTKLTVSQRNNIMDLHNSGMSQSAIAETLSFGASTVSRVISQEMQKRLEALTDKKRNISISATMEDHELVTKYADEHGVSKHIALHELLHKQKNQKIEVVRCFKLDDVIQQVEDLVAKANKKSWKFWR